MAKHGFLVGDAQDTTWIKPLGRGWKEVRYSAVDGLAVFEGCVILGTIEQMRSVKQFVKDNPGVVAPGAEPFGAGILGTQYRWKDNVIPYVVDEGLPNPERVTGAIAEWEANTPIRFVKRDAGNASHRHYVVFRPGNGCASAVGCRGNGRQEVILGSSCSKGNCIHEIGHTVGLWHEQSRSDRDDFVTVKWEKILESARHNFNKHILDGVDLGDYDYESIMHYPADAFSADGSDTIVPNRAGVHIGQRVKLSAGDIASVGKLVAM